MIDAPSCRAFAAYPPSLRSVRYSTFTALRTLDHVGEQGAPAITTEERTTVVDELRQGGCIGWAGVDIRGSAVVVEWAAQR